MFTMAADDAQFYIRITYNPRDALQTAGKAGEGLGMLRPNPWHSRGQKRRAWHRCVG